MGLPRALLSRLLTNKKSVDNDPAVNQYNIQEGLAYEQCFQLSDRLGTAGPLTWCIFRHTWQRN